jgi:hypothetical protein
MRAAFYKGTRPGVAGLYNRLGRYLDGRGKYSHTEFIFSNQMSASSSYMDGGVRFKEIGYSSVDCWDFLQLPASWEETSFEWYLKHNGQGYDMLGQIKFGLGFIQAHDVDAWFCSESNIASIESLIGHPQPHRFGPNGMYDLMMVAGAMPISSPW